MTALLLEPIASQGATVLADSVAVGTAVGLVAWALNAVFRQRSPATRFAVLLAALLATASLPLLRVSGTGMAGVSLLHVGKLWAPGILLSWTVLASIGLARIVAGIVNLRRLRQSCRPLSEGTVDTGLATTYCPSRKIEFLVSAEATVPAAIGFFRPAVVLPEWVVREMSADEVRQVVIHELSHLRRRDDWTNLLQQLVKALLFFHPAVWWMESRLSLEREMACDDAVLSRSQNPRGYAECLARIAERSFLRRGLALAQAAVSRVRQTSQRVARILQVDKSLRARRGKLSAVFTILVTVGGIGLAWRTPLLFSFDTVRPIPYASVSAPEGPVAALQPIQAAWQEPAPHPKQKRQAASDAHRTVVTKRATPETEAQVLPANLTMPEEGVTTSVVVVVMQEGDSVAVWRITTWQYSPSRQVRSARKTT